MWCAASAPHQHLLHRQQLHRKAFTLDSSWIVTSALLKFCTSHLNADCSCSEVEPAGRGGGGPGGGRAAGGL